MGPYTTTMMHYNLSQKNLSAPNSATKRFKMLIYCRYAPLSHRFVPCQEL